MFSKRCCRSWINRLSVVCDFYYEFYLMNLKYQTSHNYFYRDIKQISITCTKLYFIFYILYSILYFLFPYFIFKISKKIISIHYQSDYTPYRILMAHTNRNFSLFPFSLSLSLSSLPFIHSALHNTRHNDQNHRHTPVHAPHDTRSYSYSIHVP